MYQFVGRRMSRRQARLLMVAFCRLVTADTDDSRVRLVLETAEQCADDPTLEARANAIWTTFITTLARDRNFPVVGPEASVAKAVAAASELVSEVGDMYAAPDYERYTSSRAAHAQAVLMSLRDAPQNCFTGGHGDAVEYCTRGVEFVLAHRPSVLLAGVGLKNQYPLADILRCIIGNPFRPPGLEAGWRTEAVVALARGMYESRDFTAMPVLADAREDAGCANDDILSHCRGEVPHVRGCWVVDAVLGKA
mgnify:CR=1 FL=1